MVLSEYLVQLLVELWEGCGYSYRVIRRYDLQFRTCTWQFNRGVFFKSLECYCSSMKSGSCKVLV